MTDPSDPLFGGELAERLGIHISDLTAERAVATMPAAGNHQPAGVVNGGAWCVLGETLGSRAANVHARTLGRVAVGIELKASHVRSVREGTVTAVCEAVHLGRTLTRHRTEIRDEQGRLVSVIDITNALIEPR
ncbi:hotdog fold thioesterase [Pseudoclavibacter caeni]|jgi:1,4-dihydroxy-2-naphthoyl-CoA hydrolase|uniref:Hotdog fold thioesterase n=1 Tax=Pseudoclavibacter caeni TaxID=908846 RepID=A0A7C8FTI0_9MICO|nr:hotdog fold thioesterase [Pseudoclavibacter caeni]KAB1633002.1 hotdog fold thioesterase [Pseudoclavibacter caeni]NYJ97019.1 uncharacterized protein (TIGR00369 family) [Pseudoclavibacter caeni]